MHEQLRQPQPADAATSAAVSAALAACIVAMPGIVGLLTGSLVLFASLGPTAVMQAHTPEHPASRPRKIVIAHLVGLGAALLMTWVFGLTHAPSVFEAHALSPARVAAAVSAIALGTFLEITLHSSHPPSASTTLLVSLGSFKPTTRDISTVVVGVLIVAAVGELARRLRAHWS